MGESQSFRIATLDAAKHRREEFDCGVEPLTRYLCKRARKEMQSRACACFVAVPVSDTGRIAGYYTLSSATITLEDVPAEIAKRLARYPSLPATLLGRLARDLSFRSAGVGGYLLTDALRHALSNTVVVGSVAVVTDPKDEKAGA